MFLGVKQTRFNASRFQIVGRENIHRRAKFLGVAAKTDADVAVAINLVEVDARRDRDAEAVQKLVAPRLGVIGEG